MNELYFERSAFTEMSTYELLEVNGGSLFQTICKCVAVIGIGGAISIGLVPIIGTLAATVVGGAAGIAVEYLWFIFE